MNPLRHHQPTLVIHYTVLGHQSILCLVSRQPKRWYAQPSIVPLHTWTLGGQVFAGIFPIDTSDFLKLEESIKRVCFLPSQPVKFVYDQYRTSSH